MILRVSSTSRGFVSSTRPERMTGARPTHGPTCRVCFDVACQQSADQASLIAIAVPVVMAAAGAWLVSKSSDPPVVPPNPSPKRTSEGRVPEGQGSGDITGSSPSAAEPPERDKNNEVVLRVISYTPYPVAPDFKGERVCIKVGNIKAREKRTFAFPRILPQPSTIFTCELERPLGIVLAWDEMRKVAYIDEFIEGSSGDRASRVAAMAPNRQQTEASLIGDVVRGCTTATFTFKGPGALLGAAAPERTVVVFCPDGKKSGQWSDLRNAMKGESRDGPVTLVLERKLNTIEIE